MGVRGFDIARYQCGMNTEDVARRNSIGFAFIQTNDGTHVNPCYHQQVAAAEAAGAEVVPYFYLRPNVAETVRIHLAMSEGQPHSVVDVEEGSGGRAEILHAHNLLWAAGRRTPLIYLPQFYWEKIGRPDLSDLRRGVAGLWKSWYPDNSARGFDAGLGLVPPYVWQRPISGLPVLMVQFTGTGRLDGYGSSLDLNYYPGTRQELANLLGGEMNLDREDLNLIRDVIRYEVLATRDPSFLFGDRNIVDMLREGLTQDELDAARDADDAARDAILLGRLTDAEVTILAAIRASVGGVDVQALATALGPHLKPGVSLEDFVEAMDGLLESARFTVGDSGTQATTDNAGA